MEYEINIMCNREVADSFLVDFDNLPGSAKDYIIRYGLTQSLNDAGAAQTVPAEKVAKATARLEGLQAGQVPHGGGGGLSDPVTKRAREMARNAVKAAIKAKGFKIAKIDTKKVTAAANKYLEDNKESLMKAAKASVEAEKAAESDTPKIDLSDL